MRPNAAKEELKQSELDAALRLVQSQAPSKVASNPIWACLQNLEALKRDDVRTAIDFEHEIIHPYKWYGKETAIAKMEKIIVILEICTLYKGVPCGIAIIRYQKPGDRLESFRGVG